MKVNRFNCIILIEDLDTRNQIQVSVSNFFTRENIQYAISHKINYIPNSVNIIIFDKNLSEKIIEEIYHFHQDYIMVVVSNEVIPYYYKYHFYAMIHFPLCQKNLFSILNGLVEMYCLSNKIPFISNKHYLCIDVDDIVCLKMYNRKLYLYTHDDIYQVRGQLKDYQSLCNDNCFEFQGRSKIISNLDLKQ